MPRMKRENKRGFLAVLTNPLRRRCQLSRRARPTSQSASQTACSQRAVFSSYNLSVGLTPASSPGRGATGEPVVAVLDERSFRVRKRPGSAVEIHGCLPSALYQSIVPLLLPIRTGPGALRPIGPKRTAGPTRPAKGSPFGGAVTEGDGEGHTPVRSKLGVYSSLALLFCCM